MLDGHRVIAWTPWGRKITASILAKYLERDHASGVVDEWWLCANTDPGQDADDAYAVELASLHPWIRVKQRPDGCPPLHPKQRQTGYFYRYMTDENTIYVRLDDDIVYLHEAAIERLVRAKLQHASLTAAFAMIWNNAICSYFGQAHGVIPREWGAVSNYCMDDVGWCNGEFAVKMHRLLIGHIRAGTVDELFLYQDVSLQIGQQFSVSCFASAGKDYASLPHGPGVLVPDEEEKWHTVSRTQETGQPNVIIGNALVAHYSFFPQRGILDPSDVLDQYRALADALVIPERVLASTVD